MVRNVGNSEQLLYTATNKSAVVGAIAANRTTGILPVSVYLKKTVSAAISNKALTSNVATLTTSSSHGLFAGDSVTISDLDVAFNGTYTIISVPTTTTFTYAKTGSNVASASDTGTVSTSAVFYLAKDLRVENGANVELIDKPFIIEASDAVYALSGVQNAFDVVLSIQEGAN
jgi:hypothetical protein